MQPVLVLNFTYEALGIVDLKRAVRLVFAGKAEIVHAGARELHSSRIVFRMPSIVRMLYYIRRRRPRVPLTKKNVLLRDDYRCAYCGERGDRSMTVDHVIPKSRGGASAFENLVACCSACNGRKRDRTPEEARMPLRIRPREPQHIPYVIIERHTAPDEWAKYLSLYDVRIEERIG